MIISDQLDMPSSAKFLTGVFAVSLSSAIGQIISLADGDGGWYGAKLVPCNCSRPADYS